MKQEEANLLVKRASEAKGPISGGGPTAGWVPDHGKIYVDEETLSLSGDSRVRPAGSCCPTLLTTAAPPPARAHRVRLVLPDNSAALCNGSCDHLLIAPA